MKLEMKSMNKINSSKRKRMMIKVPYLLRIYKSKM